MTEHEHDHEHDILDDGGAPLMNGHFLRVDPDNPMELQMQCLFCAGWMPLERREYGAPSVTINPDNSKVLVFTAEFQLRAVHECLQAEDALREVMVAHIAEHHSLPEVQA